MSLAGLNAVNVDIAIVLGSRRMTVRDFLKVRRGAAVVLDPVPNDLVDILANDRLIARGMVTVKGDRVSIEVRERIRGA